MPHDVHVSWTVHETTFPPHTALASDYLVSCDAPGVAEVLVSYGTVHECTLLALPEGTWEVIVQLAQPDGSLLGGEVSAMIDVPGDDVLMDEPMSVHLTMAEPPAA